MKATFLLKHRSVTDRAQKLLTQSTYYALVCIKTTRIKIGD